MKIRLTDTNFALGLILVCLAVLGMLAGPRIGFTEPRLISIGECALNGFPPGGSIEEMRNALGEPDSITAVMIAGNEYTHLESQYDGLRIVFSMHGRSALSYYVTSDEFRLRSGVGVGSTRQEIESALGPALNTMVRDVRYMNYHLAGPDGRPIPVQLTIKLDGDTASEFSLISR